MGVAATAAAVAIALGGYLVQRLGVEDHWWSSLLLSVPQQSFAVPAGIAAIYCLVRKRFWLAYLNLGVAVAVVPAFMGPVWHVRSQEGNPGFRLMTYNVQCGSRGVAGVVEAIRDQRPDVVCLQEAYNSSPEVDVERGVRRGLPGYTVVRNGDILTASRIPFTKVETWALPRNPERRAALVTTVRVRGREVVVVNVHLLPTRVDQMFANPGRIPRHLSEVYAGRLLQARELVRRVGSQDSATVVVGDFNTQPNGRAYSVLCASMTDCFASTGRGFGYTIPSSMPVLRYDYAWVRGPLIPARSSVPTTTASDHRPLVVDFQIP